MVDQIKKTKLGMEKNKLKALHRETYKHIYFF